MALALLSVSDKAGLLPFAQGLLERGYTLLSTGGTAKALLQAGLPCTEVSAYTSSPEIFGGRVKTLHPKVHGGLLGRRGEDDAVAAAQGIGWIDVVAVNLYPFAKTVEAGASYEEAIEQIDIGGPSMLRSAAKNHASVTVVVDPADYAAALEALSGEAAGALALRRRLAAKAFRHTAAYDARISAWLTEQVEGACFPDEGAAGLKKVQDLRYGENPHQPAAFYASPGEGGRSLARAAQLQGKELSFNNLADTDAALRVAFEFDAPACAIIKHNNPCGAAIHPSGLAAAYRLALSGDPVSAYGGVVAFNRPLTVEDAAAVLESKVFFEVIAAPAVSPEVAAMFEPKKNLRLLSLPADWAASAPAGWDARRVQGGWLLQGWDHGHEATWATKTAAEPTPAQSETLRFAWGVCKHVKSNAIVLAVSVDGGQALNGVGAGQMSRVDSVKLAIGKATRPVEGAVLASDAFFPFADGVEAALKAGVAAIVQPGGSIRDEEVLAASAAAGVPMVFTGARHFRH